MASGGARLWGRESRRLIFTGGSAFADPALGHGSFLRTLARFFILPCFWRTLFLDENSRVRPVQFVCGDDFLITCIVKVKNTQCSHALNHPANSAAARDAFSLLWSSPRHFFLIRAIRLIRSDVLHCTEAARVFLLIHCPAILTATSCFDLFGRRQNFAHDHYAHATHTHWLTI